MKRKFAILIFTMLFTFCMILPIETFASENNTSIVEETDENSNEEDVTQCSEISLTEVTTAAKKVSEVIATTSSPETGNSHPVAGAVGLVAVLTLIMARKKDE